MPGAVMVDFSRAAMQQDADNAGDAMQRLKERCQLRRDWGGKLKGRRGPTTSTAAMSQSGEPAEHERSRSRGAETERRRSR
jgi:hypothetical protein